jgi:hypothetical protein
VLVASLYGLTRAEHQRIRGELDRIRGETTPAGAPVTAVSAGSAPAA